MHFKNKKQVFKVGKCNFNLEMPYGIELAKQSLFDSIQAQMGTLVREAEKTLVQEIIIHRCQKDKKSL